MNDEWSKAKRLDNNPLFLVQSFFWQVNTIPSYGKEGWKFWLFQLMDSICVVVVMIRDDRYLRSAISFFPIHLDYFESWRAVVEGRVLSIWMLVHLSLWTSWDSTGWDVKVYFRGDFTGNKQIKLYSSLSGRPATPSLMDLEPNYWMRTAAEFFIYATNAFIDDSKIENPISQLSGLLKALLRPIRGFNLEILGSVPSRV